MTKDMVVFVQKEILHYLEEIPAEDIKKVERRVENQVKTIEKTTKKLPKKL